MKISVLPVITAPMRYILSLFFLLYTVISAPCILNAGNAYYIAPSNELPVRADKGPRKKIVAVLADGTRVELLERDGDWSRIRTESGREGWILHRYLTREKPLSIQVRQLEAKNSRLAAQVAELESARSKSAASFTACDNNLTACRIAEETLREQYTALKQDAAEVLQIKDMLKANEQELLKTKNDLAAAKQQLETIKNNSNIKWFLAGAGVLIAGWIIGAITASRRRRRPSLL